MGKYGVGIPLVAFAYFEIEAETANDAIHQAFCQSLDFEQIKDWGLHRRVETGQIYEPYTIRIDQ